MSMQHRNVDKTIPMIHVRHQSEPSVQHRTLSWLRFHFREPTIKTYLFVTLIFGLVTGLLAAFYNVCFQTALQLVWGIREEPCGWFETAMMKLPSLSEDAVSNLFTNLDDSTNKSAGKFSFVYILLVSTLFGMLAGMIQKFMGFPGDLPNTVGHVHKMEVVPIRQLPSMFFCSIFTIVSGGSLGPEAPLLAMCASTTSWISQNVLQHKGQMLRDCTLIGMASGLAAFFGVGLGGALFAFEVLHRTGIQFFEAVTFGVSAGMITLLVFRGILGLKFGSIWEFTDKASNENMIEFEHFIAAIIMGGIMAVVAVVFIKMHRLINKALLAINLQEHRTPIRSGLLGGFLIGLIAILLPPTMFWSEFEIGHMADTDKRLTHIWPQGGVWGRGPFCDGEYSGWIFLLIGFFKMMAISITVLSGLRGGFIFPLMFAGASFGRAVLSIPHMPILKDQSIALMTMAGAAGLNTSITRTPFATSLILTSLSGRLEVLPPILCTALISFFITMPFEFIKTQQYRTDILAVETVIGQSVILHEGQEYVPVLEKENDSAMLIGRYNTMSESDGSQNEIKSALMEASGSTDLTV